MSNKVMVSGLALGKAFDACTACNYDVSWIVEYPSILLWADEIIISNHIWESIQDEKYPQKKTGKAIKLIFDMANDSGLVKLFDPCDIMTEEYSERIFKQIDMDVARITEKFPDRVNDVDDSSHFIKIGEQEYCHPLLWSYYASNFLADHLGANCIYQDNAHNYFNYLLGTEDEINQTIKRVSSFHNVFEVSVPNDMILHNYAFIEEEKCDSCTKIVDCRETYLLDIENNVSDFLRYRNFDEIHMIKEVTDKILSIRENSDGCIDPLEIRREFLSKKMKIEKRMVKTFPKISRWANLATIMSVPVTVGGIITQSLPITVAGASVVGAAQIAKESVEYLKNKHNWVGYVNSHKR